MTAPTFTVTKGNPTDDEIAALTAVLAELAASPATERETNLWGRPTPLRHPDVFNPGAFANITYF